MTPRVRAILRAIDTLTPDGFIHELFPEVGEIFDSHMGITPHGNAREPLPNIRQDALEARAAVLVPTPPKSGTVLQFRRVP